MTLLSLLDEYYVFLLSEKAVSEKTYQAYEKDLNDFLSAVTNKEIGDLNEADIGNYRNWLQSRGYSRRTLTRKITSLRCFLSYAEKEKGLNLALDVPLPKKENRLPVYLTAEEVTLLLKQCRRDTETGLLDYTMMALMYLTGLRVSELVGLRNDRLYLKGGYLKVFGKRNKERIVPLNGEALTLLLYYQEKYRNPIKENPLLVFVHPDGKPVSRQYFFLHLKEYAKEAGIEKNISPHTLRHSFATALLLSGANLVQVKALLGHENIKTTAIYTHLTDLKEKEVYNGCWKKKNK